MLVSKFRNLLVAAIAICVTFGVGATANAAFINVTPADYTGTRSTDSASELTATGNWANGFWLTWEVTDNGDGTWDYRYVIEFDEGVEGDPSHFNIEVSPSFTEDNILDSNGTIDGPQVFTEQEGNPNMPDDLYSIKFDFSGYVYELTSDRNPVWGDFYSKDGNAGGLGTNSVWNSEFGTDPLAGDSPFSGWIPVPDSGITIIPLPAAFWLGFAGLGAVAFVRRRYQA